MKIRIITLSIALLLPLGQLQAAAMPYVTGASADVLADFNSQDNGKGKGHKTHGKGKGHGHSCDKPGKRVGHGCASPH